MHLHINIYTCIICLYREIHMSMYIQWNIYVKAYTCKYISVSVYMYVKYVCIVDMDFWEHGVFNIIFE